jgi:hypothetical protein
LLDNFLFAGNSLTMRFGFVQLRFSRVEGPADKSLLLTIKLEFVRILPAVGDKTFTSDSVTRCSEHHIQRFVKRFDDDCFKHVLKPSSLKPVSAAVAPPITVKTFTKEK